MNGVENMKMFLIAVLSALFSIINLPIGEGHLRLSLGIIILILGLQKYKELKAIPTSFVAGLAVFLMRAAVIGLQGQAVSPELLFSFSVEILFYVTYGICYDFLVVNAKPKEQMPLIILLMLSDFAANSVEYIARFTLFQDTIVQADFVSIFLAAFVRSAIIWVIAEFVLDKLPEKK